MNNLIYCYFYYIIKYVYYKIREKSYFYKIKATGIPVA